MVNTASSLLHHVETKPDALALWNLKQGEITFAQFASLVAGLQCRFKSAGCQQGSRVLVAAQPSHELYAALVGLLGLGATVYVVEPWMPVERINRALTKLSVDLFVANTLGFIWGSRAKVIRQIPRWISATIHEHNSNKIEDLEICERDSDDPAVVTFTTGTTGTPKGVVRTHGYLQSLAKIVKRHTQKTPTDGLDLTIFVSFVLKNLHEGQGSLIVPQAKPQKSLKAISQLPRHLQPQTLITNPFFLGIVINSPVASSLREISVGGALTDCHLIEEALSRCPSAVMTHLYGSSEAEPVAAVDAKEALYRARERGDYQLTYLGPVIPELKCFIENDVLWVAGPNVCGCYIGDAADDARLKRRDLDGTVWHCMGDRVRRDEQGHLWYEGRSQQPRAEFLLEQKLFAALGNSDGFICENSPGPIAFVTGKYPIQSRIVSQFLGSNAIISIRAIARDRRHRSRIERERSLHHLSHRSIWWNALQQRPKVTIAALAASLVVAFLTYQIPVFSSAFRIALIVVIQLILLATLCHFSSSSNNGLQIFASGITRSELRRLRIILSIAAGIVALLALYLR